MNLGRLHPLRAIVPVNLEYKVRDLAFVFLPVRHRSRYDNVFHLCVWKTASQWVRVVLSDPVVYQGSGLRAIHFAQSSMIRGGHGAEIRFPFRRIVSPVYCSFEDFGTVPKQPNYRIFFVARDPRDILVSQYFSKRYSHRVNDTIAVEREELKQLSETEGLLRIAENFATVTHILRSWLRAAQADPRVIFVTYEELTQGDAIEAWSRLLSYCDIDVSEDRLRNLLNRYQFRNMSGGRQPGEEVKREKYRKGIAGDWKNYFDERLERRFYEVNGDIVGELGYQ